MVRYFCTHCGRRFEAEEKDTLECPGCYWSTSVKKDENQGAVPTFSEDSGSPFGPGSQPERPAGKKLNPSYIKIGIIVLIAILAGTLWLRLHSLSLKTKNVSFSLDAPKKEEKKKAKEDKKKKTGKENTAAPAPLLSEEEKAALNRRIEIPKERIPSESETKVLAFRAPFQTGLVEKLPSQAWTLQDYKQLISNQEKAYKVPLPGSYKRKLEKLFAEKYLAGTTAFEQGDLQQARDLWVESLAFPIYANDVKKHRGVVLTMLRPFITDTLAKTGAINNTLVEGNVRQREQKVGEKYQSLFPLLESRAWADVMKAIDDLNHEISEAEKLNREANAPPPYPKDIGLVDEAIRASLFDLLTPPPAGFADFQPLRSDLDNKKRVVMGFMPEALAKSQELYEQALGMIQKEDWAGALTALKQISFPLELAQDAEEKIKILEKLQRANPETAKSGQALPQ